MTRKRERIVIECETTPSTWKGWTCLYYPLAPDEDDFVAIPKSIIVSREELRPPEPPVGSVVLDDEGRAWQRIGKTSWGVAGGTGKGHVGWNGLNDMYGPLKVIHEPTP